MTAMRTTPKLFTMRKDGVPQNGDWFRVEDKKDETTPVYIYDEIGMWGTNASDFVKVLNEIKTNKIELHLNSPGGAVFDGLAIYHALIQHDAEVTVIVDALAASAASFIAMAGDKIVMMRNAQMMIHDGSTVCYGNEADMLATAATLSRISDNIADIYSQKAGDKTEYWRGLMREETWFSADEAVTFKLADEVRSASKGDGKETTDKWDLSFFNYAGRDHAEAPIAVKERVLVMNSIKEKNMGDAPSNTDPATETPAADPATVTDPATVPVVTPPAETDPPPATDPATSDPATPANKAPVQGVLINGVMVTDLAAIQTHINSSSMALKETQDSARKDFVNKLASDNKIAATQLDETIEFALALGTEQYNAWAKLNGSSTALPLLGNHGVTPMDQGAPQATPEASKAARIKDLEGTVAMLGYSMSEEKIKDTKAYKELHELLGTNSNS